MSDVYKIQYNGMTLAYPGWNGYVSFDAPKFKTLTLYASEGGTVTASVLTGMPGDTAQITTAYNTYYRFSGYDTAGGGSLNGDVYTFGDTDANISALYKVNYFTATGEWEKGSNVTLSTFGSDLSNNIAQKYAIHNAHTGEVPTDWYSASNRWRVPSTVSAYSITLNPNMRFTAHLKATNMATAWATAQVYVGSTINSTGTKTFTTLVNNTGRDETWNFNKTITVNTTDVNYSLSGKLRLKAGTNRYYVSTAAYVAAGTTGTWTATGIAP